ncbi:calcium-binding protein [Paracoccus fontiphilus]|uniref:Calcium-binding protein n=1 Tax=Paracoccus fontiphilus TaxID=1815556 RepID=A0ABV7IKB0_9RHOB|nr:hypothetical protein [Paracoccus fontiphilus]
MAIRFAGFWGGTLWGTNSQDILWGGIGDDRIFGFGSSDLIYGGYGDDALFGGSGMDHLRGAAGTDTLRGGLGADLLSGGSDSDYFVFHAADGTATDTIRDFRIGEDRLVLGNGLAVTASRFADIDRDGEDDTVLALSNRATIVLLGVGEAEDWSLAGPNVMRPYELDLLA